MAKKKIIIVDDDTSILEVMVDTLINGNFDIKTADSGKKAIELFKAESFDLILTDIGMPEMDGVQLIKNLYDMDLKPMVVFVTGYSDYPREKLNELKPKAIIFKPFDISELRELVNNYLK